MELNAKLHEFLQEELVELAPEKVAQLAINLEKFLSATYVKEVTEFHETFNHPVGKIDNSRFELRINLIEEEVNELKEAFNKPKLDLVECADAIGDILYVVFGTAVELGLHSIIYELFKEIHRSNMSKACTSWLEANETVMNYAEKGVNATFKISSNENYYIITRISDNKILKSINYSPANLPPIIKSLK